MNMHPLISALDPSLELTAAFVFRHAASDCVITFLRLRASPKYTTRLISGAQRQNSLCQAAMVDNGTTSKKGPQTEYVLMRFERNAMLWIVFPRPISSAKITELFWKWRRKQANYMAKLDQLSSLGTGWNFDQIYGLNEVLIKSEGWIRNFNQVLEWMKFG